MFFWVKLVVFLLYFAVNFVCAESCDERHLSTLYKLKHDLLDKYDIAEAPNGDSDEKMNITLSVYIMSFYFIMKKGYFGMNSYLYTEWVDQKLVWNPDDYDGITQLQIRENEIWTPKLYSETSQNVLRKSIVNNVLCLVLSPGTVKCTVTDNVGTFCIANFANFPYVSYNCSIRILTTPNQRIDFKNDNFFMLNNATSNNDFVISNISAKKVHMKHENCPCGCPLIDYQIQLKSYLPNAVYLIPILVLVFVTLSTLTLSSTTNARLYVCSASMILHFLYIEGMSGIVPTELEETPNIIKFISNSSVMVGIVILLTIASKKLTAKNDKVVHMVKIVDVITFCVYIVIYSYLMIRFVL